MKIDKEKTMEVMVYTAESSEIAAMLVEKLENVNIPARVGTESASAGVFAVPEGSKTIWVPKGLAEKAEEILEIK